MFVYATNRQDFGIPLPSLVMYLVAGAALSLPVAGLTFLVLARKGFVRLIAAGAGVSLYLYVQFYALVWDYGVLDGRAVDWNRFLWNGILEILLLGVSVVGGLHLRERFLRPAVMALGLLLVGEAFMTLYHVSQRAPSEAQPVTADAFMSIHELSGKRNVILIVIDTLQSDVFEEIIRDDSSLREKFAGFTYFRNTAGSFPYTHLSIQAILTGSPYRPGESIQGYTSRVRQNYLQNLVVRNGGKVSYLDPSNNRKYLSGTRAADIDDAARLYDITLFRQVPHLLKPVVLNDYRFRLQGLVREAEGTHDVHRDLQVLASVTRQSFVGEASVCFKFFHLWGTHLPVVLSADGKTLRRPLYVRAAYKEQATYLLTKVSNYFEKLKSLGVYDRSVIFLLSDHGSIFRVGEPSKADVPENVLSSALATMAIKGFQSHRAFEVSDAPVALVDVAATALTSLGWPHHSEGRDAFTVATNEPRTRKFLYFKSANDVTQGEIGQSDEFKILGFVRDAQSWTFHTHHSHIPDTPLNLIDLGTPESLNYLGMGWSGMEKTSVSQCWTLSNRAVVFCRIPDRQSSRVVVRMRTFVPGQKVELTLNGRPVGQWDVPPDMGFRDYAVAIDLKRNERRAVNELGFHVARSGQPSASDVRELGISVDWIKFE